MTSAPGGNPHTGLPLLTVGPAPASAGAATVLVHGRGRTPHEMLSLAARWAMPEMTFVAPTASGASWYPGSFAAPLAENQPQLDWALERIEAVVCQLEAQGLTRDRIALVGFSQGACLVAEYVYRHAARWGAVSILTGAVIGPPGPPREPAGDLAGTPMFVGSSDVDAWVPLAPVEATAALFIAMGAALDLRVTPGMDHIVSDEQLAVTRALLAALL